MPNENIKNFKVDVIDTWSEDRYNEGVFVHALVLMYGVMALISFNINEMRTKDADS
jgi:hypothetical protein